jgi:WD40 repeat protein
VRSEEIRRIQGHERDRTVVAKYGRNDTVVLSGSYDNTMRLWDAQSGLTIQQFLGHTDRIFDVDMSEDGTRALSASADQTVILWDAFTGEQLRILEGQGAPVQTVNFLPGSMQAVSGDSEGDIVHWDLETGEIIQRFDAAASKNAVGHLAAINDIAVYPGGRYILSASNDGTMILWDLEAGEALQQFTDHNAPVRSVTFNETGDQAASGGADGTIILWNFTAQSPLAGSLVRRIEGHDRAVIGLDFSPDGEDIISSSLDNTLRLWNTENGFELRRYTPQDQVSFRNSEFNADGRIILTGMSDGSIREWRMLTVLNELLAWTLANRFVPELTCADRVTFSIEPLCDADGLSPTSTPFPLPTPTVTPDIPQLGIGGTAIVNTDNRDSLNLRADTAVNASIIERLIDGETVELLEGPIRADGYTWWRLRTAAGNEGWAVESVPEDGIRTLIPNR